MNFCTQSQWDLWAIFFTTQKCCVIFSRLAPIVPKISDHSEINAPKINAKENFENVDSLSRKLHFCENCYIWGKAIAGTAKIFPSIVIYLLAHDRKIVQYPHGMITIT